MSAKPSTDQRSTPYSDRSDLSYPSAAYRRVLAQLGRFARDRNATILLEGESGTGKTILARYIHARSPRAGWPFQHVVLSTLEDPFGLCPENAANGTLCVDLFIQAKSAWGFRGDNRGFDANADASRSRMQITFRPGDKTGSAITTGSCSPLGCYAPYKSNNVSIAAGKGGSITVKYNAEDSAGYGLAPELNGSITFTPDGKGGWTTSGNRDNYPNLGIYQRTNGAWKTLQERPGAQDLMGPARMAAPWPNDKW